MGRMFELVKPPINTVFHLQGIIWRVCYHNQGQDRISLELVGARTMEGEVTTMVLTDGTKMTEEAFERYCRERWPQAHEVGRNPKNPTLGVKSGTFSPGAKFKP